MRRVAWLWPLLFVWALLGVSQCTESSINTDSPAQVGGAILIGQTFGNQQEQRAAEMGSVLKDFRRADHEQKGDRLSGQSRYAEAADEYRTALDWVGRGVQQDRVRANLETDIGVAMMGDGSLRGGTKAHYRETAGHFETAANLRTNDPQYANNRSEFGSLYMEQGWALHFAGDYGAACNAAR